jgi:hypothetical protein
MPTILRPRSAPVTHAASAQPGLASGIVSNPRQAPAPVRTSKKVCGNSTVPPL